VTLRLFPSLNGLARYRFTLEYLGGAYKGVQFQPGLPTIEGVLRRAIKKMDVGAEQLILGARTDAGVGAVGQVGSIDVGGAIPSRSILRGLNACLPRDIRVKEVVLESQPFHPRGTARYREYHYWMSNDPIPLGLRHVISEMRHPLDVYKLNRLASMVLGTHDFSGFQNEGSKFKSSIKTVVRSEFMVVNEESRRFSSSLNLVCYVIVANSFLYRMVRNLVGALVNTAGGRLSESQFTFTLEHGKRQWPYKAAPAEGLELFKIYY